MKRRFTALFAALMLGMLAPVSLAQTEIKLYIAPGALEETAAAQLIRLLERALPDAAFVRTDTARPLEELVMADEAPQLVICPAREAAPWAEEGLTLALDGCVPGREQIAQAVINACGGETGLYMAPLYARHARVAVNRSMLEKMQLGHLLDEADATVWLPIQLYQVMEGCLLDERAAVDVWPATKEGDAVLAMVQALYNSPFLSEDGQTFRGDSDAAIAGMEWLEEMADCGMVGIAESREAALKRFLDGETAMFIDWTDEERKAFSDRTEMEIEEIPYPSAAGVPVYAFDVIGAAAFASGDEEKDVHSLAAVSFLMEDAQAQRVMGERGIREDGGIWLPCFGVKEGSRALHGMLCDVTDRVLAGQMTARTAMEAVSAVFEKGRNSAK